MSNSNIEVYSYKVYERRNGWSEEVILSRPIVVNNKADFKVKVIRDEKRKSKIKLNIVCIAINYKKYLSFDALQWISY